jgi:protein TonB
MQNLKFLLIGFCLIALLSCAGSGQKIKVQDNKSVSGQSGEQAPILIKNVKPDYPPDALARGETATIWLKVYVDTLGKVSNPIIEDEIGDNLRVFEQSAIEAALKTKWKPARSDGKPISVWVTFKVDFKYK